MDILKYDAYNSSSYMFIGAFILSIIIIISLVVISPENVILKHILFIVFTILIGVLTFPVYENSLASGLLFKSITTVLIIMLALTLVANAFPAHYFDGWGPILMTSLVGLIIFELLQYLILAEC